MHAPGERLWTSDAMNTQNRWGTVFMVQHGDRYFVNNEDGELIIAQFTPEGLCRAPTGRR